MNVNTVEEQSVSCSLEGDQQIVEDYPQDEGEENQYENVVYADGTILLHNGQYFIPANGEAIVLQDSEENFSPFVISDEAEESQLSDISQKNVIQYIQSDENGEPTVYELSDGNTIQLLQSQGLIQKNELQDDENSSMELLIDEPGLKKIKLDIPQSEEEMNQDDEPIQLQLLECDDGNMIIENDPLDNKTYQFAVLKNNKLQFHTIDSEEMDNENLVENMNLEGHAVSEDQLQDELAAFEESIKLEPGTSSDMDLMHITGKNLITGQVVTLDNYFEKIYNGAKKSDLSKDFIDGTAFTKTKYKKSRKFVGKIISIQKPGEMPEVSFNTSECLSGKENETNDMLLENFSEVESAGNFPDSLETFVEKHNEENEVNESTLDENITLTEFENLPNTSNEENVIEEDIAKNIDEHMVILDHTFTISEENINFIKKTIEGLMQMESVQKKIMHKYLQIKLIERRFVTASNNFKKSVSYAFGKMEFVPDDNADGTGNYIFVVDNSNFENGEISKENGDPLADDSNLRYLYGFEEMTSVTIINTISKEGTTSLRVKLNQVTKAPTCKICNYYFKSPAHLKKHFLMMHQNEEVLSCQYCEVAFTDHQQLAKHQKAHEKITDNYVCSVCNKTFSSQSSLKRHMTVHDKSLRVLECSMCKCRFPNEYSLKKHLVIHTGIRPYSCEKCHRSFVYQSDLNYHKRIHESAKLVCKICGREFSRYSNLVRHEEIHKGDGALYKCEICGCSYNYVSSLTRHMVQYHIKSDGETT